MSHDSSRNFTGGNPMTVSEPRQITPQEHAAILIEATDGDVLSSWCFALAIWMANQEGPEKQYWLAVSEVIALRRPLDDPRLTGCLA